MSSIQGVQSTESEVITNTKIRYAANLILFSVDTAGKFSMSGNKVYCTVSQPILSILKVRLNKQILAAISLDIFGL